VGLEVWFDYLKRLAISIGAFLAAVLFLYLVSRIFPVFADRMKGEAGLWVMICGAVLLQAATYLVLDWNLPDEEFWHSQSRYFGVTAYFWHLMRGDWPSFMSFLLCVLFAIVAKLWAKRIDKKSQII
jgi:hypothetical protein